MQQLVSVLRYATHGTISFVVCSRSEAHADISSKLIVTRPGLPAADTEGGRYAKPNT